VGSGCHMPNGRISGREGGFAIAYILVFIALFAAVTAAIASSSGGTSSHSEDQIRSMTEISGQLNLVRSAISQCAIDYPQGTGATQGPLRGYPVATAATLDTLTCPGTGLPIFLTNAGASSNGDVTVMPKAPAGTAGWRYSSIQVGAQTAQVLLTLSTDPSVSLSNAASTAMCRIFLGLSAAEAGTPPTCGDTPPLSNTLSVTIAQ